MDIRFRRHCSPEPFQSRIVNQISRDFRRYSTAGDLHLYRPDKVISVNDPVTYYSWNKYYTGNLAQPITSEEIRKEAELRVKGRTTNGPSAIGEYSPVRYRVRALSTPPYEETSRPVSVRTTTSYYPSYYYPSYYNYYSPSYNYYPYKYSLPSSYYTKYSAPLPLLYDKYYATRGNSNGYYRSPYYSSYYSSLLPDYKLGSSYLNSYLLPSERYYSYADPLLSSYYRYPSTYRPYYTYVR